jgi:hypothetical protein
MPKPLATHKKHAEKAVDLYWRALEEIELKNLEGYEDNISHALKDLVKVIELSLRDYLSPALPVEKRQELFDQKSKLSSLIRWFEEYGKPKPTEDFIQNLHAARMARNSATHEDAIPKKDLVEHTVEVARELFSTYFSMTLDPPAKPSRKYQPELQIVEMKAATAKAELLVEVTSVSSPPASPKDHPVLKLKRPAFRGNRIARGQVVEIAKPQPQPSAFWYDPYCSVSGIMRDDGEIDRPTSYRIRFGSEEQEKPTLAGLCIPSYGVPVEFRELSYVRSELWGPIKKYVVRNVFAVSLGGHPAAAVVSRVINKPKPGAESVVRLLLQSQLYDDVLKTEWRGYKALENALSINALYRNNHGNEVTAYTPRELREYVDEELVKTGLIKDLVAHTYGGVIEERFYEADYVYRVFRGIIARNSRFNAERKRSAIGNGHV